MSEKNIKTKLNIFRRIFDKKVLRFAMYLFFLMSSFFGGLTLYNLYYVKNSPPTNIIQEEGLDTEVKGSQDNEVAVEKNLIEIPKLKMSVEIFQGNESVLNKGIWHRFPDRGDPEKGGNFILSGHRLTLGISPKASKKKSPLYYIDKVKVGDTITVFWNKKKYEYKVFKVTRAAPYDGSIEEPTKEHVLTLYTCSLKGYMDKRVVILASKEEQ